MIFCLLKFLRQEQSAAAAAEASEKAAEAKTNTQAQPAAHVPLQPVLEVEEVPVWQPGLHQVKGKKTQIKIERKKRKVTGQGAGMCRQGSLFYSSSSRPFAVS